MGVAATAGVSGGARAGNGRGRGLLADFCGHSRGRHRIDGVRRRSRRSTGRRLGRIAGRRRDRLRCGNFWTSFWPRFWTGLRRSQVRRRIGVGGDRGAASGPLQDGMRCIERPHHPQHECRDEERGRNGGQERQDFRAAADPQVVGHVRAGGLAVRACGGLHGRRRHADARRAGRLMFADRPAHTPARAASGGTSAGLPSTSVRI